MSFHEKTLWLTLVALLGVYSWYFASVLPGHSANVLPWQIVLFCALTILLVIVQAAGAVLLILGDAIGGRIRGAHQTDERDRLIEWRASHYGSLVLATGVFCALTAAVFTEGNFVFTHLLLAFWVLAQVTGIALQVAAYRRSA